MTLGERMKRAMAAVFASPPIIPVIPDLELDGNYWMQFIELRLLEGNEII